MSDSDDPPEGGVGEPLTGPHTPAVEAQVQPGAAADEVDDGVGIGTGRVTHEVGVTFLFTRRQKRQKGNRLFYWKLLVPIEGASMGCIFARALVLVEDT